MPSWVFFSGARPCAIVVRFDEVPLRRGRYRAGPDVGFATFYNTRERQMSFDDDNRDSSFRLELDHAAPVGRGRNREPLAARCSTSCYRHRSNQTPHWPEKFARRSNAARLGRNHHIQPRGVTKMAVNPPLTRCEGGQWCQARNATGSTVTAGTGVILSAVVLPSPIAGAEPGAGIAAYEFTLPLGATTTSGFLGVVVSEDVPSGDVGFLMTAGVISCTSNGTGSAFGPLTPDALGRMKAATVSGCQVCATAIANPVGGAVWARIIEPYALP